MWEWILATLNRAVNACNLNKAKLGYLEKDDIVSNVAYYLCQNVQLAETLYCQHNVTYLYTLVRRELYEQESKTGFANKGELCHYQKIMEVCEQYNIPAIPENAYKISTLIDSDYRYYSIAAVSNILTAVRNNVGVECSLEGLAGI